MDKGRSAKGSLGKSLVFKTVNGEIDLSLPKGVNSEVGLRTVNGNISIDFPLTAQGSLQHNQIHGKIGSGGSSIRLETVNGSIHLRRSP
jgi:DUF4097 and DUF4098 domain-containing protein YvlB